LFLGPPGNGKTHAVKSIVSSIGHPSLYVKSLTAEYGTNHQCIASVFSRARTTAPCILVLEDIDALVTSENRSFFLNELDGFASNHGILTIGTTNHPERLDPAILERPSRFDRKYTFGLPGPAERVAYLAMFANKLEAALQLDKEGLQAVANATDGYSFAYLKELYLSAMMRWIAHPGETSMSALMVDQSEALRAQMTTDPGEDEPTASEDMDDFPDSMTRSYMRRWRR
jgi:AAA+ superfamily predicted ATPase